jgi:hypothetical protein
MRTIAASAGAQPSVDGHTRIQAGDCFREGTHLLTLAGETPVEQLREGDLVLSHNGAVEAEPVTRRIGWIGLRDVRCGSHPRPASVWPVRIRRHAFAPGAPSRDLFLSPDHAVFLQGVLVPVKLLINGGSIAQVQIDRVKYYHIELTEHAVVLAEGLEVESCLGAEDRRNFVNGGTAVRLFPDFEGRDMATRACAPLVFTGHRLEQARAALDRRAGQKSA